MSPIRFNAIFSLHIVQKTQLWNLRLAEFNITFEHITGELKSGRIFSTIGKYQVKPSILHEYKVIYGFP